MKLTFNKNYLIAFFILFALEVAIAAFLNDGFIRHTVGDFIVVIVVYCFLKSFLKTNSFAIAIVTLIIACTIEFLQLTELLKYLGLEHNKWANLIFGNTFSVEDLVAYTLGIVVALFIDIGKSLRKWFLHSFPST